MSEMNPRHVTERVSFTVKRHCEWNISPVDYVKKMRVFMILIVRYRSKSAFDSYFSCHINFLSDRSSSNESNMSHIRKQNASALTETDTKVYCIPRKCR